MATMESMPTTGAPTSSPGGDSVVDFLRDNIWVPILGALAVLIVVSAAIAIIVYKCRRNQHYDYTVLHDDMALPNKIELQRHQQLDDIRDAALLNCSFYLRSSGMYSLADHLPEIGSRISKHWFLVRDTNNKAEKLLTMAAHSPHMVLPFNNSTRKTMKELLPQLEHPHIFPIDDLDFTVEQGHVVIVQPFNNTGSLKDFIYRSHCCDHWSSKYNFHANGLPVKQIQEFGLQILNGILFLEERGYPVFGHLHSGNIMVQNNICRLSGCENVLLGFTSKMEPLLLSLLKENRGIIDTLCFGHVLYEMATGFELEAPQPQLSHWQHLHDPTLQQLFKFIFENPNGYPTIREISAHRFFRSVALAELGMYVRKPVYMSTVTKSMFKIIRKGYPSSKRLKQKRDSATVEIEPKRHPEKLSVEPRKRHNSITSKNSKDGDRKAKAYSKNSKPKIASKPKLEDRVSSSQLLLPEGAAILMSGGNVQRQTLLDEIHRGVALRSTERPLKDH